MSFWIWKFFHTIQYWVEISAILIQKISTCFCIKFWDCLIETIEQSQKKPNFNIFQYFIWRKSYWMFFKILWYIYRNLGYYYIFLLKPQCLIGIIIISTLILYQNKFNMDIDTDIAINTDIDFETWYKYWHSYHIKISLISILTLISYQNKLNEWMNEWKNEYCIILTFLIFM